MNFTLPVWPLRRAQAFHPLGVLAGFSGPGLEVLLEQAGQGETAGARRAGQPRGQRHTVPGQPPGPHQGAYSWGSPHPHFRCGSLLKDLVTMHLRSQPVTFAAHCPLLNVVQSANTGLALVASS